MIISGRVKVVANLKDIMLTIVIVAQSGPRL